jgi:hypothetical protein
MKFEKKKDLDWNELINPIIKKRKNFFRKGVIIMVGINEKNDLEGIRLESHSFDEDGDPEENVITINSKRRKEQFSYIG